MGVMALDGEIPSMAGLSSAMGRESVSNVFRFLP